ncbi:hypothetical protein [Auraticoccus monumenti]|uniref:Uncharacterized protein n=1 Tax=Auraticoccus monumenti TaxID=675864 RepID=A0A1G6Z826_9ACTN|nr:hypothetical protein [Auraticoccus monumenti]SDD98433.1 hypothetical protein SAMN04489747_2209 [Auraticoccus monumenti]
MPARLSINPSPTGATIGFTAAAGQQLDIDQPVVVQLLGGTAQSFGYDGVEGNAERGWVAVARPTLADGTRLVVTDQYRLIDDDTLGIERQGAVAETGTADGLRIAFSTRTAVHGAREADWQFFIPGTLYNRNDNDGDGVEDYLGTYVQDVRDDKNGILGVLARDPGSGSTFTMARLNKPTFDTAVTPDQLSERYFVQETDIGSLGLAPVEEHQVALRGSFPFSEEYSFCLDTDGSGWAGYLPMRTGVAAELHYELRATHSVDLTEAIWEFYENQRTNLATIRPDPDVTLEESLEHRQLLTQLYYRNWEPEENAKEPAGYLVHFSPRTGKTLGSLLEFGFSGDQALLAYVQTVWGQQKGVPLYAQRAARVLDFFVDHCQLPNGFSHGIYDPLNDQFTHWFTGILMPFQYAEDESAVRRYVGKQIADALMPIARELRDQQGNYLRTMCESVYPLLLTYLRTGQTRDSWRAAGERFGAFLLDTQADDGSWFRAYAPDGTGLTSPAAWFGASYQEQKSGTIFPIPVLALLHQITGDDRYRQAAARAADFIIDTFVDPVAYMGGLNDTTHIKSVKTDSVGVMFLMRSLLKAHQLTGAPRHLAAAVKAAKILASWVYLWDVPMPPGTLLDQAGFKSTGWAGCDVIAGGTYLDNEFLEFTGDLANVAVLADMPALLDIAELVEHGMQHAVSTPRNDHGYVAPGIQCEGVLTSYWLSAPDTTEFSGAVNKVKGDDNDTCNALINGQAAYGLYDLMDSFGTTDFAQIRHTAWPAT